MATVSGLAPLAASDRRTQLDTRALLLLLTCCTFWGLQQVLIKWVSAEVPPMWQVTLRTAGATVLVLLWSWRRGVPLFTRDGTLFGGLLVGTLCAAQFTCTFMGLQYTAASRLTVFAYTAPFWVALLIPFVVPAERLRGLQWLGLGLAFGGVVLAFSTSFGFRDEDRIIGDVLGLASGLLWGLGTVTIRATKLREASVEKTLIYQVGMTALLAPLMSLALGETWSLAYSPAAIGVLLVQTLGGAFASYLAWMWLLRFYPATQVSSFTFLTPLLGLVFGVVLLGEALTWRLAVALLGVTLGVLLVNRRRRQ